jgi:molybdenum cofactor biosynthesis protein C
MRIDKRLIFYARYVMIKTFGSKGGNNMPNAGLTHFDEGGAAIMVDVSGKEKTHREAIASGRIYVSEPVYNAIEGGTAAKGDVLGVARIAGIMAAKRTSDMIPLCHPLPLAKCTLDFALEQTPRHAVCATATVKVTGETGVEMEALHAVSTALLTIYDMCKAIDKRMEIGDVRLERKSGGKSGTFVR